VNGGRFGVRVVTARCVRLPDGKRIAFDISSEFSLESKRACLREAERLQAAFDKDCEPKRAYVTAPDGVPCAVGGVPQYANRASAL
jgi:hypothetical protein